MPRWLAWTLASMFVLALALHAHEPWLRAGGAGTGYSETDLRALLAAGECRAGSSPRFELAPWFEARESGLAPLGALGLAVSTALWSDGGTFGGTAPLALRLENLLLYALGAAGGAVFLRRMVAPWVGDEHARAAAWVSAVLCLVHPLAYAPVVSLAARGDLLALAFSTWSGAEFLRARQARAPRAAIRAGVGTLLAGFASPLALALPPALAAAEFIAGRRYRTLGARLRTSAVTFAAYGACALAEPALRAALGFGKSFPPARGTAAETLALALEKLGVLALPVSSASLSFAAYLLAAGLLVLALEPAFSAARAAPRLWTSMLGFGAALLLAACFLQPGARVEPLDFTRAEVLLPGCFVVSSGCALAATALSGLRRALTPAIVAAGWSAIAHVHAGAWSEAVQSFDAVRAETAQALLQEPPPAAILLLDVPELVQGIAPLDRARPQRYLASPGVLARGPAELERWRERCGGVRKVAAPTRAAFVQFLRTQAFEELRADGVAVALPGAVASDAAEPQRVLLRLPPLAPSTGTRRWFHEGVSSELDWDSSSVRSVTAHGPRDVDRARAPWLGWQSSGHDGQLRGLQLEGVWIEHAGEPLAHFDVSSSVEWLCSGRVRKAWPIGGWSKLSEADAQDELPVFDAAVPVADGDDWRIALDSPLAASAQATLAARGESLRWRLALLDLESLEAAGFELDPVAGGAPPQYVARGAGRTAARWTRRGHALAWSVECAAGPVALVRSSGVVQPPR